MARTSRGRSPSRLQNMHLSRFCERDNSQKKNTHGRQKTAALKPRLRGKAFYRLALASHKIRIRNVCIGLADGRAQQCGVGSVLSGAPRHCGELTDRPESPRQAPPWPSPRVAQDVERTHQQDQRSSPCAAVFWESRGHHRCRERSCRPATRPSVAPWDLARPAAAGRRAAPAWRGP